MSELIRGEIDGEPLTEEQLILVLRAAGRGGQRDHAQRDQRGAARVLRAPRRVGEAARPPRAAARRRGGDPALGHSDQPLHAHRDRGLRGARGEDPRGRAAGAVLRVGESRRGGVRGSVRVPRRPPPEPATSHSASASTSAWAHTSRASSSRSIFRHLLDAPRVVRGVGARGAPELDRQRKHQAPAAPLPPGVATSPSRLAARSRSAPDFTLALPVSESSSSRNSSTRRGTL